jgi:heptosyltransferase II
MEMVLRILIIRYSSLGDVALAALLVNRLRDSQPEARINFLTRAEYLPILEAMPGLDGRFGLTGRGAEDRKLSKDLGAGPYDAIIDLQNNFRSRMLTARLRSTVLLRYRRPRLNRWARIHLPKMRSRLATPLPVAVQYLKVAETLGVTDNGQPAKLSPRPEWMSAAQSRLGELALLHGWGGDKLIVAAPGGRHATKIWPAERWAEMLDLARNAGFERQILIGAKEDAKIGNQIAGALSYPVANLSGTTELGELMGLIAGADLIVSGDSGPMHLAAGLGKPLVAIFGPTVPEFGFAPFRAKCRIVQVEDLICRPCHPHGPKKCPLGHFRCMLDIKPKLVMNSIEQVVGSNRAVQDPA